MKVICVWIAAMLLAPLSVSFSTNFMQPKFADEQPAVPVPLSGFVLASVASNQLKNVLSQPEQVGAAIEWPDRIDEKTIALAKRAFRKEPFATNAILILGLASVGDPDNMTAGRAVMRKSFNINKRDVMTNLWLIADYAKLGNPDLMLDHFDVIMRSNSSARDLLMPQLAATMQAPQIVDSFERVLSKNPPWMQIFWTQVRDVKGGLVNAAILRRKIAKNKPDISVSSDVALLDSLLKAQHFDDAKKLYLVLAKETRMPAASFARASVYPPFDWQIISTGNYGGSIDTAQSTLEISALSRSGGLLARKLVHITQPDQVLAIELKDNLESGRVPLEITLFCAEGDKGNHIGFIFPVKKRENAWKLTLPVEECAYYWLDIKLRPADIADGIDLRVKNLALTPARD